MLTSTPAAVHLDGLVKRYGDVTAVDGVQLTVAPGSVVALLGPNGAGKSTTVDLLLGLTRPDAGRAELFGEDPRAAVVAGRVGAHLQSGGLLPDSTVAETLTLVTALHRRAHRQGRGTDVGGLLERSGLTGLARRRVGTLSGGQQQRVRFALALAGEPDLLVLDEPTTGLDVEARRAFWATLRAETARGRTVLFATHYLEEADDFADRIVLLRGGRVVADGTAASIKAAVSGRVVRATLPGADAVALAALPGVRSVEVRGDAVLLTCDDSDAAARELLRTAAHDVEITAHDLEDAVLALTAQTLEPVR